MTRIAGIEIVQAATFQRVSSGNLLLICGKPWVFALLLCALAPSTGAQPVAGNSPPADVALTSYPRRTNPLDKITPVTDTLLAYVSDRDSTGCTSGTGSQRIGMAEQVLAASSD